MSFRLPTKLCQCMCIVLLCILCYGDTLHGEFVFDDTVAIVKNQDVRNPNTTLSQLFSHDFWGLNINDEASHKSFRPLTIWTFQLEHNLYGLKATPMKITNFLLHVVVSCLLLWSVETIQSDGTHWRHTSLVTAMLFAVHPIHSEAVCGVVGRAELLVALIYVLGLLIYFHFLKSSQWISLSCVAVFTFIGLFCKETGIMLLPICASLEILRHTNILPVSSKLTRRNLKIPFAVFLRILVLAIITIILIILRMWIINFSSPKFKIMDNPIAAAKDFKTKVLSQNFLYALNFWLLLCPDWLSFDWALGSIRLISSFSDVRAFGVLLFNCILILLGLSKCKNVLSGTMMMVVPFLPASGIVKLGFVIAERVLYIPSIGFCMIIAQGVKHLCWNVNIFKKFWKIFCGVLIMAMVLKTRHRAREWTNEELLFSSALSVCPDNAKVYYNIARLATDKNDRVKAFQYYHKAISLYPEYESAIMNLGNLYREQGDLQTAEVYLKKSVEILNEFPAAWMNLGIVQASLKKYDLALKSYRNALKHRRIYPTCHYNMGNMYIDQKNFSMALKCWQKTVDLDPRHSQAWANILALMDNRGQTEEVISLSEVALRYLPNNPAILFTRANAFGKLKMFVESERLFRAVIDLVPTNALYHGNLGVLYHRWNKKALAIKSYKKSLELDPNLAGPKEHLAALTRN